MSFDPSDLYDCLDLDIQDSHLEIDRVLCPTYEVRCTKVEDDGLYSLGEMFREK